MPSATFTHTSTAAVALSEVWAALDKPETWEAIGGVDRVVNPTIDDQGRLRGFSFDTLISGKAYRGQASSAGRKEGESIAWHVENSEVTGLTTVDLKPMPGGTSIKVSLTVESRGFLAGVFFSVISSAIGNGLPASVDNFAAGFERSDDRGNG
ncbi:MAG: hypothetical protein WBM90_08590 [Acidimicrobiia bacterium]